MDLYIAIRGFKRGKIFDHTEDGLEEITTRTGENGQQVPAGYTGFILPFSAMKDDIIRLARRGQQVDEKFHEYASNFPNRQRTS